MDRGPERRLVNEERRGSPLRRGTSLQLAVGVAFILGVWVRQAAVLALFLVVNFHFGTSAFFAWEFLRDGTGLMQCVAVKAALPEALFEEIKNLTQESSIIVTGKIRAEQRAETPDAP